MSVRAVYYLKQMQFCPNGELITRSEKLVGLVLADAHQDKARVHTFPDVSTIAEDAMTSERQCYRILGALERKGVILRQYPAGKGRGSITFYFFPELDKDTPQKFSPIAVKNTVPQTLFRKDCHDVTLSGGGKSCGNLEDNRTTMRERVTEGCHKGDISHIASNNREQVQQKQTSPLTPPAGGDTPDKLRLTPSTTPHAPPPDISLEDGVERVMRGCKFTAPRFRKHISAQIMLDLDDGVRIETTAKRMIEQWRYHCEADLRLKFKFTPAAFFSEGHWRDDRGWCWDAAQIEKARRL